MRLSSLVCPESFVRACSLTLESFVRACSLTLESFVRACSLTLAPLRGGLHGRRNCGIRIELLKHDALIPFHAESLSIL